MQSLYRMAMISTSFVACDDWHVAVAGGTFSLGAKHKHEYALYDIRMNRRLWYQHVRYANHNAAYYDCLTCTKESCQAPHHDKRASRRSVI